MLTYNESIVFVIAVLIVGSIVNGIYSWVLERQITRDRRRIQEVKDRIVFGRTVWRG